MLASFQNFFDGMGKILVGVVSLIVCGEFFASGIIKSGALATLIAAADSAGFGRVPGMGDFYRVKVPMSRR